MNAATTEDNKQTKMSTQLPPWDRDTYGGEDKKSTPPPWYGDTYGGEVKKTPQTNTVKEVKQTAFVQKNVTSLPPIGKKRLWGDICATDSESED